MCVLLLHIVENYWEYKFFLMVDNYYFYINSLFSFLTFVMNFLGWITPNFFLQVAICMNKSPRTERSVSVSPPFSFAGPPGSRAVCCCFLYSRTLSLKGRQKYSAWSTELA